MARTYGGVDPEAIREGFQRLSSAGGLGDIHRLVDEAPIFSAPPMHMALMQEMLRQERALGHPIEGFLVRYDDLFTVLHARAHERLAASAASKREEGGASPVEPFAPPFFLQLAAQVRGTLPSEEGPTFKPATDLAGLRKEVASLLGREVELPAYQPTEGALWSAILVACAACGRKRLDLHAQAVDLRRAPELLQPLREGRINSATCPDCTASVCRPLRLWVQEGPEGLDRLAALTCAWRLGDSVFVYQPPAGTPRMEANDLILQSRFDALLRHLGWKELPPPREGQPRARGVTKAVAYTLDQLRTILEDLQHPRSRIPMEMEVLTEELSSKLSSKRLSPHEAEQLVRKHVSQLAGSWPILNPGHPVDYGGEVYRFLVTSLIAESCAEAQGLETAQRALFALQTAAAFRAVGETGLTESALARADDLLAQVPTDHPLRADIATAAANQRADFLDHTGRHEEAQRLRGRVLASPLPGQGQWMGRLAARQLESNRALSLFERGHFAEALEAFPRCVEALRQMEREAAASTAEDARALLPGVRHTLSGDLANWAALLTEIMETLKTLDDLQGMPDARQVQRLKALQKAEPILVHQYPSGGRKAALQHARQLLEEALQLSESVQGWEFAGIQAQRLALLLDQLGQAREAEAAMDKVARYAARVGDHARLGSAHAFMAERALKRGEGARGLELLRASAREELREQVGRGHHGEAGLGLMALGNAALEAVEKGGDATMAILVAESLKAATTAATLTHGHPSQPSAPGVRLASQRLNELLRQREALRLKVIWAPAQKDAAEAQLQQVQRQLDEERRSISLRDPRYGRWVDATDLDISDSERLHRDLRKFGPNTTLMGILPVGQKVWTYAAWEGGGIVSQQPLPATYVHLGGPGAGTREGAVDASRHLSPVPRPEMDLEALAAALLAPLDARLKELRPEDRLIVSPFGALSRLPFSALPHRGKRLCELVCVTQVQGLGVLEACIERPTREVGAVLCLGDPARTDVPSLPGALAEAEQVVELCREAGKQVVLLKRQEATIHRLQEAAGQSDVLHLACHAHGPTAPGALSWLLLAPEPERTDSGNLSEDRILTELLLQPGCLVNLVGCNTGTQDWSSLLIGGLVPAFLVAGAGGVIASLWPLKDQPAARFQAEFYRLLLASGRPAESLARVQRACIAGALGREMKAVDVWGAYALYGIG